jgi:hypothetical protein
MYFDVTAKELYREDGERFTDELGRRFVTCLFSDDPNASNDDVGRRCGCCAFGDRGCSSLPCHSGDRPDGKNVVFVEDA